MYHDNDELGAKQGFEVATLGSVVRRTTNYARETGICRQILQCLMIQK